MKHNALALALLTAATTLPSTSQAADDFCSRLFIYAVNQLCQLLPNGQSLCQPVGLAGPSPSCESPGASAMVQVPLGPPVIQMPQFPPYTAGQNSFALPSFGANPFGINPFAPNPLAPNPYTPAAAYFPSNMMPARPYPTPMPTPMLPKNPAPAANINPAPQVTELLTKLVPEQTAKQEVAAPVPETANVASSEIARPSAALPATPDVASADSAATTAAPTPIQAAASAPVAAAAIASSAVVSSVESSVVSTPVSQSLPVAATPAAETPVTESTVATPVNPDAAAVAMPAPAAAPVAAATTEVAPVKPVPAEPAATAAVAVPETLVSQSAEATRLPEKTTPTVGDALAHFEFDSAELTEAGRSMLDDWIKQASGKTPIVVTGHTDRLGPEPYNEKLSLLRAEAVKKYLAEKGKTAKRIVILGKGEKAPVVECAGDATPETKSCLAPNRRAEITLKPVVKRAKVSSKPGKTQSTR